MSFLKELEHLKIKLGDISSATNNFSEGNLIAQGGFGDVYMGKLSGSEQPGSTVAVKKLDRSWGQGDHEFWTEILLLSRYRHKNLVPLVGFCDESDEKILVYEYQSNGSLDNHLSNYMTLTWRQRLKICLGAAHGLDYLHNGQGSQQRVLHRDLKSSNILLDQNWEAKIADFGLSKIGPANQQFTFLISRFCGTPGYVDPLYFKYGFLTKESDVYSFGVVLFEVLCGRSAYFDPNGDDGLPLAELARLNYEQGKLEEIIDPNLSIQMKSDSLGRFASIAYQCLKEDREDRPKMSQIVEALEDALELQKYQVTTRRELAYQSGYHPEHLKFWETMLPHNYKEIISKSDTPDLAYDNEYALFKIFRSGVLFDGGKRLFRLDSYGENIELISATEFVDPESNIHSWKSLPGERFPKVAEIVDTSKVNLIVQVSPRMLLPGRMYAANLVFRYRFHQKQETCGTTEFITLNYKFQDGSNSIADLAEWTDDGWMAIELCHFFSSEKSPEFEVLIKNFSNCINGILLLGIEFRTLHAIGTGNFETKEQIDENISQLDYEYVEYFVGEKLPLTKAILEDTSYLDHAPNDIPRVKHEEHQLDATYEECRRLWKLFISIPRSERRHARTYDLYRLLCKGLISPCDIALDGGIWYSISKVSGKHCPLLAAKLIIGSVAHKHPNVNWEWKSLPESRYLSFPDHSFRFSSVAELKDSPAFQFRLCVMDFISRGANYVCYLVYKLPHTSYGFGNRLKVSCSMDDVKQVRTIHFSSRSPMIKPKNDEKTYDPTDFPNIKGLPAKRKDGWMEVMLWDIGEDNVRDYVGYTDLDIEVSPFRADVSSPNKQKEQLMSGIIVEGVEFRPM